MFSFFNNFVWTFAREAEGIGIPGLILDQHVIPKPTAPFGLFDHGGGGVLKNYHSTCATHDAHVNDNSSRRSIDCSERYKGAGSQLRLKNETLRIIPETEQIIPESLQKRYVMQISLIHLEKLMQALADKTRLNLDANGFDEMTQLINESAEEPLRDRYLSDTLHNNIKKGRSNKSKLINLQSNKIDTVAQFLGYRNVLHFIDTLANPVDAVLSNCAGTYLSYLRRNTGAGAVLCSPVSITAFDGEMLWTLRGPNQEYKGKVKFVNGCLFVLMQSENGKEFHHAYQIGQRKEPKVLRGIFSGVTTAFEPIGGRAVLIRTDKAFDQLNAVKMELETMKTSNDDELKAVANFLKEYSANNLSLNKPKTLTFGIDDLIEGT